MAYSEFMPLASGVHSLDICYDVVGYKFTIRSSFDMMMDPDSGDIILKLQNDSVKTTKS